MDTTTKLQLKTTETLWKEVLSFRIRTGMKNNNEAVVALINKGLKPENDSPIITRESIPLDTEQAIRNFCSSIPIQENNFSTRLFVLRDNKSGAFFAECHLKASDLVNYTDPDISIDPELQEEYRANRVLEPDNTYYLQMVEDAIKGRAFSDIVIEYNT